MKRMPLILAFVGLSVTPFAAGAAGVSPATATKPELERAQTLFLEGKTALDSNQPQAALEAFRASYETVASPNSHLFMARCLSALGDYASAYREYALVAEGAQREAAHDAKYTATAKAAAEEQAELRPKLGFVVIRLTEAPPEATVSVGELQLSPDSLLAPIPVNPGLVEVKAASPSSAPTQSLVMIAAGEEKEVVLSLAPPPSAEPMEGQLLLDTSATDEASRKRLRTAAFVAGGVGAAGLVTFAVAGSMARSQYSTLKDECGGPCPSRQSDIDAGRRSQTIANIGLAVGAVGLGAGTVLYLVSRPKAQDSTVGAASVPPLTAEVAAGPSWLGVRGTFR